MSFKVNWSLINVSHHKLLTSYFPLSITFTIEFFISKPMFCESGVPPLGVVIFMFATKIEKKNCSHSSREKELSWFDLLMAFICVKVILKVNSKDFLVRKKEDIVRNLVFPKC